MQLPCGFKWLEGMRWAGHVVCMGEMNVFEILFRKPEDKRVFRDLGVYDRIVLK
jgi:hypothetical protein